MARRRRRRKKKRLKAKNKKSAPESFSSRKSSPFCVVVGSSSLRRRRRRRRLPPLSQSRERERERERTKVFDESLFLMMSFFFKDREDDGNINKREVVLHGKKCAKEIERKRTFFSKSLKKKLRYYI